MSVNLDIKDIQDLRDKMEHNLELFATVVLNEHLYYKTAEHQKDTYRLLQTKTDKPRVIILPRSHSKSTMATLAYPLWCIAYQKKHFIVIVSETEAQSKFFLEAIKDEIEFNERFHLFYGNLKNKEKWAETEIETINTVKLVAKGTGQKLRGLKWGKYRPDAVILDDIESEGNTETKEQRDKLKRWILGSVRPCIDKDGEIIYIGTIVHEDSYLNQIRFDTDHFVVNDSKYWQVIDDNWEKPLWEERWTVKALRELLTGEFKGNEDVFYQEYFNRPISPQSQIFKPEYLKYYPDDAEIKFEGSTAYLRLPAGQTEEGTETEDGLFRDVPVYVYIGVDPALGKAHGDYTAIMDIAITPENNVYVLHYIREKLNPTQTIDAIFDRCRIYKDSLFNIKIETTAYQEALVTFMREESRRKNIFPRIVEVKPRKSKGEKYSDRNTGLEPRFRAGQIHIRPSMTDLKMELITYPKSAHDDLIDALWNALYKSYPAHKSIRKEVTKKSSWKREKKLLNWRVQA